MATIVRNALMGVIALLVGLWQHSRYKAGKLKDELTHNQIEGELYEKLNEADLAAFDKVNKEAKEKQYGQDNDVKPNTSYRL